LNSGERSGQCGRGLVGEQVIPPKCGGGQHGGAHTWALRGMLHRGRSLNSLLVAPFPTPNLIRVSPKLIRDGAAFRASTPVLLCVCKLSTLDPVGMGRPHLPACPHLSFTAYFQPYTRWAIYAQLLHSEKRRQWRRRRSRVVAWELAARQIGGDDRDASNGITHRWHQTSPITHRWRHASTEASPRSGAAASPFSPGTATGAESRELRGAETTWVYACVWDTPSSVGMGLQYAGQQPTARLHTCCMWTLQLCVWKRPCKEGCKSTSKKIHTFESKLNEPSYD